MHKFREKLEKQKAVLSQRLKDKPSRPKKSQRTFRLQNNKKTSDRSTLLWAIADYKIKQVKDAIQRIDQGRYGQCDLCGDKIQLNRLEALPTASSCWECKLGFKK